MCLTPWISASTFVIEVSIASWLFGKAKSKETWLSFFTVTFLALYQLSEVGLCVYHSQSWNLFGYLAVTWLPAFGIHLAVLQTKKRVLVWPWYVVAAIFSGGMVATPFLLPSAQCDPLFSSYYDFPAGYSLYEAYYMGTIALTMILLASHIWRTKEKIARVKDAIVLIGFLSFVIPAFWIKFTVPFLHESFPSIFCFFAVFYAISLVIREHPKWVCSRKSLAGDAMA